MKQDTSITKILNTIISFAQERDDIRYIIQNGARVNPSVIPDAYADFDIIMGCQNPLHYVEKQAWISEFGTLLLLQRNEMQEADVCWPIFLMQFKDGLRIDLQFYPGDGNAKYHSDSLSRILLDKDRILSDRFEPSEATYIVSWYTSWTHNWNINCGKFGKFLLKYADKSVWDRIEKTYYTDTPDEFWVSLFQACELVQMIDNKLRRELQVKETPENGDEIIEFLKKIQRKDIYGVYDVYDVD